MSGRALCVVIAAVSAACGNAASNDEPLEPQGEVPRLGRRYQVEVELLSATNCGLDGLAPVGGIATATVSQRGAAVEWSQARANQAAWKLSGRICLREGGVPELVLRGALRIEDDTVAAIGRDRVANSLCEIRAVVPDAPAEDVSLCDDPNAITLAIGECGVLTAEVSSRLSFSEDCAQDTPCRLTTRWRAAATALPSLSPEEEAELAFPLPCLQ